MDKRSMPVNAAEYLDTNRPPGPVHVKDHIIAGADLPYDFRSRFRRQVYVTGSNLCHHSSGADVQTNGPPDFPRGITHT